MKTTMLLLLFLGFSGYGLGANVDAVVFSQEQLSPMQEGNFALLLESLYADGHVVVMLEDFEDFEVIGIHPIPALYPNVPGPPGRLRYVGIVEFIVDGQHVTAVDFQLLTRLRSLGLIEAKQTLTFYANRHFVPRTGETEIQVYFGIDDEL